MAGLGPGPGVLVTRSQPGADATARRLAARGYCPVLSPVLRIAASGQPKPPLGGVQALIATSAHGVAALAILHGAAALPLYCLAGASLEQARASDPDRPVRPVRGDAQALCARIARQCRPQDGALLWVRGQHAAVDVQAVLARKGFAVRVWQAYAAHRASALSEAARQALRNGAIKAVLVHSARGAQALAALAARHGLALDGLAMIAISARAAVPLHAVKGVCVHVAASPDEDAIMATLGAVLPASGV